MSYHLVFSKSYDSDLEQYIYYCNGLTIYSSEDLSEDELRDSLEVLS